MKLYRMHRKGNLCKGIWQDAPCELEIELSSQYGNCGSEGLEEDDYFAVPSLDTIVLEDIEVLIKYGYVISCIEVSAWGEVYDGDILVECVFKMEHVISVEEVDMNRIKGM